jgi:NADPH:quinone reductase-like Zn-dependent oxidoreductase
MKALVLRADTFGVETVDMPECNPWEVLVRLRFAALNHRDQWIRAGQYAKIQYPSVLGSDGMGVVEKTGSSVDESWIGKEVIINPNIDWGNNPAFQDMNNYQILGMPANGTLAEYIKVHVDRLHEKPGHLSDPEAAALPLAGLTAYNALFNKGKASREMDILVSGVGGGVAQFAFQFALAIGARVWVTSSKEEVLEKCIEMGAHGRINYHRPDFHRTLREESGGFDLIIDSAGGDGMNDLLSTLNPAGRYVFFGATRGIPSGLNLRMIFWKHLQVLGSTMGSDDDFVKMLEFVGAQKIHPLVDRIFPLDDAVHAFDRMRDGFQFGKIVIDLS